MKFITLFLITFFSTQLFSQQQVPDLSIDLLLHDNQLPPYGGSSIISFGLDSTATDGIDPQLGEWQYPTDVCPGWLPYFCAKFILPPFDGSLDSPKDFRFGLLPFTGQKIHRIYCITNDIEVMIEYDLPTGVTLNLSDVLGGVLFTATLENSGSYTIPYQYWISGQIRMFVDYNNVIPVELTSFTASVLQNEKEVQLNWTTATETNNSGYEVLRSVQNDDGWNKIGFVPGYGTTTEPKLYSFTDEDVTTGIYKYCLKQIDFNGTFTYSNEIKVEVDFSPKEFVLYQNYPNPFNPSTTIKYQIPELSLVTLKIFDVVGNEITTLVKEEKPIGSYKVEFDASSLPSGVYFYKLQAGSFIETKKMIIIK
jgi:hypothetical protein